MNIQTTPYPGIVAFKENLESYVDRFLAGEVIAFRGANCSADEQVELMQALGDRLGWWPNTSMSGRANEDPFYYETHHQSMNEENTTNKEALMLGWHLEHVGFGEEQYLGACWSMNLFICDPDAGKTMFSDVLKVYQDMSEDDKEFLDMSTVQLTPKGEPTKDDGIDSPSVEVYKFVQNHWILQQGVPRPVLNNSHVTELIDLDGQAPSQEQKERFNNLFDKIVFDTTETDTYRTTHSWEQGDLLILDVFRLAHAITGGFTKDQRTLKGIFGLSVVD